MKSLKELGMNPGQQYETIITTINEKGETNTAPFGVFCKGEDKIMCRIFKGSNSLENILKEKEFVVNITNDPLMFTLATIDNIPNEYLTKIDFEENENKKETKNNKNSNNTNKNKQLSFITNCEAYFKVKVTKISEGTRNDNIKKSGVYFINGDVVDIKINIPNPKALNRAMYEIINSLVNYSRIDLVDTEKQTDFINKFKESERIIKKVGNKNEKESIKLLKKQLIAKNYKL